MNTNSSILLLGIGTTGTAIARQVKQSFGDTLRYALLDTDATSGQPHEPFLLLGGNRLSGHGAGGDLVVARLAAEESIKVLEDVVTDVRLVVIVTALGGGTGGGATIETVRYLSNRGIPNVVFATTPFTFEGEERQRNARGVIALIEEFASATFLLPLNKLVGEINNMAAALQKSVDTIAAALTLFWRLVEKPGYIKLDTERLRHLISRAGRGRFAVATAEGDYRAATIVDTFTREPLLAEGQGAITSILCGVLAGDDLRLSEIGQIASGIRSVFGERAGFELATVNDEATFAGKLSVVVMLFEAGTSGTSAPESGTPAGKLPRKPSILGTGPQGRGRFNNVEPTIWNGEDLDTPTFIRHNINLDYQ